jgi:5-methylcytosine-specific restriction enzyme A
MPRPRANPHKHHWRKWYDLTVWYSIRKQQLLREPLCRVCQSAGRVTAAVEVDHVVEHRGDWNSFLTGQLQSLCSECHRAKSARGLRKSKGFSADGSPLDPEHPWNKAWRGS